MPAKPSGAEVSIDGLFAGSNFATFSGTFGGVTLSNVDLTGVTTWQGLANTLQAAFRRADGNRSDISVTLDGLNLKFTDAKGRGTATSFAWTVNSANTGAAPTAASPTDVIAGAVAQPQQGGPNVANSSFINQVVQQYTQAQFEQVIGNPLEYAPRGGIREARPANGANPTSTQQAGGAHHHHHHHHGGSGNSTQNAANQLVSQVAQLMDGGNAATTAASTTGSSLAADVMRALQNYGAASSQQAVSTVSTTA